MILKYKRRNVNENWHELEMKLKTYYQILKEYGDAGKYITSFIHEPVMIATTFHQSENVSKRSKIAKQYGLGCDVELGGIGTSLKSVSTIVMIGGVGYLVYKFKLFKGLKWLTDAFRDLKLAPKTIAVFEDEQLNVRGSQIEKMFNVLRQKADNFTTQYGKLYGEWLTLKNEIKTGAEGYGKTFYESGKMQYFGSKSSKEKMTERLDSFRTKVLTEVRNLQAIKKFKIKGDWTIISGLGCFPFC